MSALALKVGAIVGLLIALVLFEQHRVGAAEKRGFDRATSERAARDLVAVVSAATHNTAINSLVTKDHDEKLAPVVQRIITERVRIGTAICPARPVAEADDASGGNGANPPGRLVRADIERDFVALKLAVENDLATGRACQAWGREHGFVE